MWCIKYLYCLQSDWSGQYWYCPKGIKFGASKWIIHLLCWIPFSQLLMLPLNQTTAFISDEKIAAASVILEALGNCSTGLNKNASRCTQHVTVDFDSHGLIASVMFQVDLCETRTHYSLITKDLLVYGVTNPNLIQGIVLPLCQQLSHLWNWK